MAEGHSDGDITPRALAVVVVIAGVLVLAVAAGMLLTGRDDTRTRGERVPASTPAPSPTVLAPTTTASAPEPAPAVRIPTPVAPPIDLADRRVGDDCTHDNVISAWEFRDGDWVCVPKPPGTEHYIPAEAVYPGR
ncbi:DUF3597 domain-containing protein [Nocardia otitidiscaviarum]|uniref:DUF3597 domain-containing protein n=1 Tax=Nocardia otitidiscaviarum TaxID=1823 RepID=A0A516NRB0_9NOCA|nr:DUF3597 domain-containing protein [Nocardia otitidiscaviarum]MBF6181585.1 hypothetical protein [Nocardia otitidiscaviarum]MCP9620624.1 hypothetical protein [Nocardia otitidiscaviarum]QDP81446.1 DUF3597 domain-containing protein [Nocardia otitidiscaviarum]